VAGFRHALTSVGFAAPSEEELRVDIGPPVGDLFTGLGLPAELLEPAVAAYRAYYRSTGMRQASVYAGVPELLDRLGRSVVLATATAKLTTVVTDFLTVHGLSRHFAVVNGTDDTHHTKTETLTRTLELLGGPDPGQVLMVGDRHSDITAAHACGVGAVGVLWGYGSPAELEDSGPDHLVARPAELLDLLD
jgi:phosphoglycolate phosphatase